MKHLLLFEDFNIDNLKAKFKIRDEIFSYFDNMKNINHNRKDVTIDKVIFWYAKNLNNSIKNKLKNSMNNLFGKPDRIVDFNIIKNMLDYLNFKSETLEEKHHSVLKEMLDNLYSDINVNYVNDYIFSSLRDEKIDFINSTIEDVLNRSIVWHKELKSSGLINEETNKIIIDYGDYYWVDLESNDCEEEGSAMGHCGRTNADTILSLRERKKNGFEPHVTIAIDGNSEYYSEIYQIKGKGNKKPVSKYHKYIVDFLIKNDEVYFGNEEYDRSEDFSISDLDYSIFKNEINILFEREYISLKNIEEFTDEYKKYYIEYLKNNNKLSQSAIAYLYYNRYINVDDIELGNDFKIFGNKLYGKVDLDILKSYLISEEDISDKNIIKNSIKYSFRYIEPKDRYKYDEIGFNGQLDLSEFPYSFIEKIVNYIVKENGFSYLETFIDKNLYVKEMFKEYRADWDMSGLFDDKELLEKFIFKFGIDIINGIENIANKLHTDDKIENYDLIEIINSISGIDIIKDNESYYILINSFISETLIEYDPDIMYNDLDASISSNEITIFKGDEQAFINSVNKYLKDYTLDYKELETKFMNLYKDDGIKEKIKVKKFTHFLNSKLR